MLPAIRSPSQATPRALGPVRVGPCGERPDQFTSPVRVEAIDLIDDVHSGEGGAVGGGEQLLRRAELAPLRRPAGQGVENNDLDLVIADEAGLVGDGFELRIVGFGLSAALLAAAGVGLGRLGGGRTGRWIVGTGIAAALVQVTGLSRWALIVPGLSDDALRPARTQDAYRTFQVLHTWLGTIVGETMARQPRTQGVAGPRGEGVPAASMTPGFPRGRCRGRNPRPFGRI
jgi:hypothetical protein